MYPNKIVKQFSFPLKIGKRDLGRWCRRVTLRRVHTYIQTLHSHLVSTLRYAQKQVYYEIGIKRVRIPRGLHNILITLRDQNLRRTLIDRISS